MRPAIRTRARPRHRSLPPGGRPQASALPVPPPRRDRCPGAPSCPIRHASRLDPPAPVTRPLDARAPANTSSSRGTRTRPISRTSTHLSILPSAHAPPVHPSQPPSRNPIPISSAILRWRRHRDAIALLFSSPAHSNSPSQQHNIVPPPMQGRGHTRRIRSHSIADDSERRPYRVPTRAIFLNNRRNSTGVCATQPNHPAPD